MAMEICILCKQKKIPFQDGMDTSIHCDFCGNYICNKCYVEKGFTRVNKYDKEFTEFYCSEHCSKNDERFDYINVKTGVKLWGVKY